MRNRQIYPHWVQRLINFRNLWRIVINTSAQHRWQHSRDKYCLDAMATRETDFARNFCVSSYVFAQPYRHLIHKISHLHLSYSYNKAPLPKSIITHLSSTHVRLLDLFLPDSHLFLLAFSRLKYINCAAREK